MNLFWLIYFITLGSIILTTALITCLYNVRKVSGGLSYPEKIPTSHVLTFDVIGAIPVLNVIVLLLIVCLVVFGIFGGDLEPKKR